jgi:hypothetical protein
VGTYPVKLEFCKVNPVVVTVPTVILGVPDRPVAVPVTFPVTLPVRAPDKLVAVTVPTVIFGVPDKPVAFPVTFPVKGPANPVAVTVPATCNAVLGVVVPIPTFPFALLIVMALAEPVWPRDVVLIFDVERDVFLARAKIRRLIFPKFPARLGFCQQSPKSPMLEWDPILPQGRGGYGLLNLLEDNKKT